MGYTGEYIRVVMMMMIVWWCFDSDDGYMLVGCGALCAITNGCDG